MQIAATTLAVLLLAGCADKSAHEALGTLERDRIVLKATAGEIIIEEPVHGELLIHQRYPKVNYCRFHQRIFLSDCMRDVNYLPLHILTTIAKPYTTSTSSTTTGFFLPPKLGDFIIGTRELLRRS
jgi:hypothetical protein